MGILNLESKVKSLVSILFSSLLVLLVRRSFIQAHCFPRSILLLVEQNKVLSLDQEGYNTQRTNRNTDFITTVVVWCIISAVYF